MSDKLLIPDISEYQQTVDWNALVGGGTKAAIVRVYNGSRPDRYWPANRTGFWNAGGEVLGLYAYLIASRDAESQAISFCDAVGQLRPGEFAVLDVEDGTGPQAARARAWRQIVESRLNTKAWVYSGQYFYRDSALDEAGFPAERTWIAAYSATEPTWPAHSLWQFTDHFGPLPGITGTHDASWWNGTLTTLKSAVTGQDGNRTGSLIPFPGAGAFVLGKSNPAVTLLGKWLIAKGYGRFYKVGPSDNFGTADLNATRQFQTDQGWSGTNADGYPGPETWRRLQL